MQDKFSHTKIIIILACYALGFVGIEYKPFLLFLLAAYGLGIWIIFPDTLERFKDRDFLNENTLMIGASIAAFCLGAYIEAASILVLYVLSEHFQSFALFKSKQSLKKMLFSMPNYMEILQNGQWVKKPIQEVGIGDRALLRAGDRVALDICIKNGNAYVDSSAISGESTPVSMGPENILKSGAILLDGMLEGDVIRDKEHSYFHQMQRLVEESLQKKTKIENSMNKFGRIYTPIIFGIALFLALVVPIFMGDFKEWIYRGLVVLMVSCPCALILCVPLGYSASIGALSRRGILLKQSGILDEVCRLNCIVLDKTGTLSEGKLFFKEAVGSQILLGCAKSALFHSNHIIAKAIHNLEAEVWDVMSVNEIAGRGVIATSPRGKLIVGNAKLLQEEKIEIQEEYKGSDLVVYVAKNDEYQGYILFEDRLKAEAQEVVSSLGLSQVFIFSGDREESVSKIAQILQCRYKAGMLPDEKYQGVMELKESYRVMFVGDGINDAAALACANVGVSMGDHGSDLAQNSADVVLLSGLKELPELFGIAKKMRKILWQNIIFIFSVKIIFIILGVFGLANIWEAIFGDVGVSLLVLLNVARLFL